MDATTSENNRELGVGVGTIFGIASGKVDGSRSSSSSSSSTTTTTKRKTTSLPNETVEYLKAWMMSPEHIAHPYPTEGEKAKIMEDTGIEMKQLTNWFVNNRKRFWKPRVEARMREQKILSKTTTSSPVQQVSPARKKVTEATPAISTSAVVVSPKRSPPPPPAPASKTMFPLLRASPTLRTVSGHNSMVSLSDLVSSDDEASVATATKPPQEYVKTESVNVHILRPTDGSAAPQLSDVTVLANIPPERVLRTFENCAVTYHFSDDTKAQSRRDAEIVRIKKHYLAVFLAETAVANTMKTTSKKRQAVHVVTPDDNNDVPSPMPRRKFRRHSVELWKEACQTANHVYCQTLPSLEEATQLFGYTSS